MTTAYRDAKIARERAEAAVTQYTEITLGRELAAVDHEIKAAQDALELIITNGPSAEAEWAERIRSKGYLLLIQGVPSHTLALKKAKFAVEQARSKKAVLEGYTKFKTLKNLNNRVATARDNERAKKTAYDGLRTPPVGLIEKVIRSNPADLGGKH